MADLGFVKAPVIGGRAAERWVWPFAQMEIGDYFRVAPEDKPIQKVRTTAMARAFQLGIRLSVRQDEQGNAIVRRVDPAGHAGGPTHLLNYKTACDRVSTLYSDPDTFNTVPWEAIPVGRSYHTPGRLRDAPATSWLYLRMHHDLTFQIALGVDGITVTRLADGALPEEIAAALDLMK